MQELEEIRILSRVTSGKSRHSIQYLGAPSIDDYLETLMDCVCFYFDVMEHELKSKFRPDRRALPRHIFCYIAKNKRLVTYTYLGVFLGGRDHTTTRHSHKEGAPSILLIPEILEKHNNIVEMFESLT